SKELGRFGEAWAAGYLTRHGYAILKRNVRYRAGEIDIIARDGADLVFIEVKCRQTRLFGSPEESISQARFKRLSAAVELYLQEHGSEQDSIRVDVMAIEVGTDGRVQRSELLRNVEAPLW
ncbi:MAG: YraN family protein, partial [Chloroflexota bacterium]